jgi:hypothetical protein
MDKKLKCKKDKILGFKEKRFKPMTESGLAEEEEDLVMYFYKGNELQPVENEVIHKRTPRSRTIRLQKNKYQAKFWARDVFHKDKTGKWFEVKADIIKKEDWEKEYGTGSI